MRDHPANVDDVNKILSRVLPPELVMKVCTMLFHKTELIGIVKPGRVELHTDKRLQQ